MFVCVYLRVEDSDLEYFVVSHHVQSIADGEIQRKGNQLTRLLHQLIHFACWGKEKKKKKELKQEKKKERERRIVRWVGALPSEQRALAASFASVAALRLPKQQQQRKHNNKKQNKKTKQKKHSPFKNEVCSIVSLATPLSLSLFCPLRVFFFVFFFFFLFGGPLLKSLFLIFLQKKLQNVGVCVSRLYSRLSCHRSRGACLSLQLFCLVLTFFFFFFPLF